MENKTVFIFGAGSTTNLNIPTTKQQDQLVYDLESSKEDLLQKLLRILNKTFGERRYHIGDVYNIIDSNLLLKNALQYETEKIEYYELERCRKMLITHIFKEFIGKMKAKDNAQYEKLVSFYKNLAQRELDEKLNCSTPLNKRDFFVASYSIINFNWDLYSLLPIIEANDALNHTYKKCRPGGRNPQLRIFTDFNCEYACADKGNELWYPFTEPVAFAVNSDKYDSVRRVILTKCFYPHGAMNLFKCTSCAKHSYYLGALTTDNVIHKLDYDSTDHLYKCPYCGKGIYSTDFDILAQSNFKVRNSFLEETRLSMMQDLRTAKTLVFIGYSMPNDDVDYITMFKSLYRNVENVYVVLYKTGGENRFVSYDDLDADAKESCKNYHNAFGGKAVYNMAGFPDAADVILKEVK